MCLFCPRTSALDHSCTVSHSMISHPNHSLMSWGVTVHIVRPGLYWSGFWPVLVRVIPRRFMSGGFGELSWSDCSVLGHWLKVDVQRVSNQKFEENSPEVTSGQHNKTTGMPGLTRAVAWRSVINGRHLRHLAASHFYKQQNCWSRHRSLICVKSQHRSLSFRNQSRSNLIYMWSNHATLHCCSGFAPLLLVYRFAIRKSEYAQIHIVWKYGQLKPFKDSGNTLRISVWKNLIDIGLQISHGEKFREHRLTWYRYSRV